ncbi:exo-beta-N-acetylmuramidase NamZ family protein [Paraflavitalea devenefica]|uniref:exo-beta-N-acetylmuramidase NamZ family protein n=1 Tax=Paraflavitalea devenefica TaxID=2716334 RepID=UPI001FE5B17B|nr:DUF1343 domain-containing protein [Paraflavitalea devenefica]
MTKNIFMAALTIATAIILCSYTGIFNRPNKTTDIPVAPPAKKLITGADQTNLYINYLKGKRVGFVGNNTSIIGNKPSIDSLLKRGVKVVKIFGPEHGFRGNASNGAHVGDFIDSATGIPVISLYGKNRKPSKEHMQEIDIMIYDIQDVGCRFYTYINTLANIMETCAENNKELMIFDRPNPNGYLVDGPILEDHLHSGIGKFRIPITHGCTIGEFAQMLNGEGWLQNKMKCKLKIIKCANYTHDTPYASPISPSPNLNTPQSVLLYPTLCLFEGTIISQGRGTYIPFTVLGAPLLKGKYTFTFRPVSIKGMKEAPLHQDTDCYGLDLRKYDTEILRRKKGIHLQWLIEMYKAYPDKARFFDQTQSKEIGNFDKLAGTENLKKQIIAGVSEQAIRKSWEPGLSRYKQMRKKYLLYP